MIVFCAVSMASKCKDQSHWDYYCDTTLNLTCLNGGICNKNHRCDCPPLTCGGNCCFQRKFEEIYIVKLKKDPIESQRYLGYVDQANYIKSSKMHFLVLLLAIGTVVCFCHFGYTFHFLMRKVKKKKYEESCDNEKYKETNCELIWFSVIQVVLYSSLPIAIIIISSIYYHDYVSFCRKLNQIFSDGMVVDANGCCLYYV